MGAKVSNFPCMSCLQECKMSPIAGPGKINPLVPLVQYVIEIDTIV